MCTPIAANTASTLLLAQAIIMSKILAVSTIVGILALNFREQVKPAFRAILKLLKT